jgi:hypothetical protein
MVLSRRRFVLSFVLLVLADTGHAAVNRGTDPLQELNKGFPKSVEIKNHGRLVEFCPDNTCDAFVASANVPIVRLRDFAYLYVYFFSDFTYLDEWRNTEEARKTAERVLVQPVYSICKSENSREAARCILKNLSRNGRIELIFVRYDEGERNVVRENLAEKLKENSVTPRQ